MPEPSVVDIAVTSAKELVGHTRHGPVRPAVRLLRSELRLVFGRRRNLLLLAVLAAFPILLGIGLRFSVHPGGGGGGLAFAGQLAGNGIFLSFIALPVLLTLVLPLAMAVVAGDSMAGEAASGTLRYLLAVPAGRTRLLAVKYAAIVTFGLSAASAVTAAALLTGVALFPVGPVTLLSGTTVPLAAGLVRLLFVTLYVAAAMAALGAAGLAISTLTEHPIGAIAAAVIIVVASEVADTVPQFAVVQPYLLTHWWDSFGSLLLVPIHTAALLHGLLSFAAYAAVFISLAWVRFTTADVTS